MQLTPKQQQMIQTWDRDALFSFPAIQWRLMGMQARARQGGMNITRPSAIRGTLNAMKAAFGLKTSCRWLTFVEHMELFVQCSEVVSRITGERAPESMQNKGGLPPLVEGDEPEPEGWQPE